MYNLDYTLSNETEELNRYAHILFLSLDFISALNWIKSNENCGYGFYWVYGIIEERL